VEYDLLFIPCCGACFVERRSESPFLEKSLFQLPELLIQQLRRKPAPRAEKISARDSRHDGGIRSLLIGQKYTVREPPVTAVEFATRLRERGAFRSIAIHERRGRTLNQSPVASPLMALVCG